MRQPRAKGRYSSYEPGQRLAAQRELLDGAYRPAPPATFPILIYGWALLTVALFVGVVA